MRRALGALRVATLGALRVAALGALLVSALAARPAAAFVPSASKLTNAAARTNGEAGRAETLRVAVALYSLDARGRLLDPVPVASGELLTSPDGQARLELVGRNGVNERHLLRGASLEATRDGQPLVSPRPLLPPLPLLQMRRSGSLANALRQLGVRGDESELGRSHGNDCFVVGGRSRVPGAPDAPDRASLWLDAESYQIVRIDRRDGTSFRFGPLQAVGRINLPAWVEIRAPGVRPYRLTLREVEAVRAPADAFSRTWLAAARNSAVLP